MPFPICSAWAKTRNRIEFSYPSLHSSRVCKLPNCFCIVCGFLPSPTNRVSAAAPVQKNSIGSEPKKGLSIFSHPQDSKRGFFYVTPSFVRQGFLAPPQKNVLATAGNFGYGFEVDAPSMVERGVVPNRTATTCGLPAIVKEPPPSLARRYVRTHVRPPRPGNNAVPDFELCRGRDGRNGERVPSYGISDKTSPKG